MPAPAKILVIDSGLASDHGVAVAYNNRGQLYRAKGDVENAIKDFDAAIKINPNDSASLYNRGSMLAERGETDRAIADFDQSLKLNPNQATAYNDRGSALMTKGAADRAIAKIFADNAWRVLCPGAAVYSASAP